MPPTVEASALPELDRAPIPERQARLKATLPLLGLDYTALAAEAELSYDHVKTLLGKSVERKVVDPHPSLDRLAAVLARVAAEKGVTVTVDVQPVAA